MAGNHQDPGLTAKGRSWKKKVFPSIALIVASLVISIVIIEWTIRLILPVYDPSGNIVFQMNPDGVLLAPPNFKGRQWKNTGDYDVIVEINRYGLRDHKDLRQSNSNDILVVGDSFAFGHGVAEEKRFSNILQQKIGIPIFNVGIPGDLKSYEKLVKYARKNGANIKKLIVSICMENDLFNYEIMNTPVKPESAGQSILRKIKNHLTNKIATYNMLTNFIHQNIYFKNLAVKFNLSKGNALMGIENATYDNNIVYSSFSQLKNVINGTDAVILIIPSRRLWIGNNIEIERKVHESFVTLIRNSNLPMVDMKPIFEASGNPLQYYFRQDAHWNEAGHAKAAEALAGHFYQIKSN